jgi:hypothetical protein
MIMKLGTLLAAGRSLVPGCDGKSPYHIDKHVYLPEFGSLKSPFLPSPRTEAVGQLAVRNAVALAWRDTAANAAKTQKPPALSFAATSQAAAVERPAVPIQKPHWPLKWMDKLNLFAIRRAHPPLPLKNAKTPTRAKLSLDAVKVLRNDLSDADVEIVPLKSRPPCDGTALVMEPAKKSWAVLGERLLEMEVT